MLCVCVFLDANGLPLSSKFRGNLCFKELVGNLKFIPLLFDIWFFPRNGWHYNLFHARGIISRQ
jgi:hypothetical protein